MVHVPPTFGGHFICVRPRLFAIVTPSFGLKLVPHDRNANQVFRSHLQFRRAGGASHAECNLCCGFKQELRSMHSFNGKLAILERYTEHLLLQWLDRQVWWAMTVASQRWFQTSAKLGLEAAYASNSLSVGAVIADGMDHARGSMGRDQLIGGGSVI
jgi:hypothetical protein